MLHVKSSGIAPTHTKFMLIKPRRDVGMPTCLDVRIYSQGNSRSVKVAARVARCFLQKDVQLPRRLHIELQNPRGTGPLWPVAEPSPNLLASLAHAREHDAIARHTDVTKVVQLPAGNYIETAAALRQ